MSDSFENVAQVLEASIRQFHVLVEDVGVDFVCNKLEQKQNHHTHVRYNDDPPKHAVEDHC